MTFSTIPAASVFTAAAAAPSSRASNTAAPSATPALRLHQPAPTPLRAVTTKAAPSSADCFPGVQYLFTGRYLQTTEGIENPIPSLNAIHDFSQQAKGFAYMSTFVDPVTRLSLIAGTSTSWFQIPNVPGQPVGLNGNPPVTSAFGITNFNSSTLNENQYENTQFGVLALQRSADGFDGQLSYFTRYNFLHFMPDPVGDLLINGIASDITRESYSNGIQGDASYIINDAHTLRTGFTVSGEQSCGRQPIAGRAGRSDGQSDRRAAIPSLTTFQSSAGSPASTSRTSGSSPTTSNSTTACASTRCGSIPMPISLARGPA